MNLPISVMPFISPGVKYYPLKSTAFAGGTSNQLIASVSVPQGISIVRVFVCGRDTTTAADSGIFEVSLAVKNYASRGVKATGVLTFTGQPANAETVTIGTKVYTFQTTLTNVDGNVKIGTDTATSIQNLVNAINLGPGAGTAYAAATTAHPSVTCTASNLTTLTVSAISVGTPGNAIATTDTVATTASWGGGTLTGGVDTLAGVGASSPGLTVKDDAAWAVTVAPNTALGTIEVKVTADAANVTTFNGYVSVTTLTDG